MPHVIVIAGPNGAGKSTAAPSLIGGLLGIEDFVNADVIARGLSAFNPEGAALEAGRIMLARLRELAAERRDFAFETTLASRSFAPWIASLREEAGYEFHLNYLWVPDPELSIARVAHRVREGGHHVPDDVVRRRYRGGLRNFFDLYQPIADHWRVFDVSHHPERILVARGDFDTNSVIVSETWNAIRMGAGAPASDRMGSARRRRALMEASSPSTYRGVMISKADPDGSRHRELATLLRDDDAALRAINKGIRDAMIRHKKLGESIAVWDDENSCVKIVPPEDIVIDDE